MRKGFKRGEPTLPVNLILKGRKCLIVGGGRIAARKIANLLDAKARVTVVSPTLCPAASAFLDSNRITWIKDSFSPDHLKSQFLILAATDDTSTNTEIIRAAHEQGILCSAVDNGWELGDFISPAVFRSKETTISVSTGGSSCRKSRMIKNTIARTAPLLNQASLLVIGTDHNCTEQDNQSAISLSGKAIKDTGSSLKWIAGLHEFFLLQTCNRTELYAVCEKRADVVRIIRSLLKLDRLKHSQHYIKWDEHAFLHSVEVLAGARSQAPGEYHIVSQFKDALELGLQIGSAGASLQEWAGYALKISRTARSNSCTTAKTAEVESLAADFILQKLKPVADRKIAVAGTGTSGTYLARKLSATGAHIIWLYHRNKPSVSFKNVTLQPLSEIAEVLPHTAFLVSALKTDQPAISASALSGLPRNQPLEILDISSPKSVSPNINRNHRHVKVHTLQDLKKWQPANLAKAKLLTASCSESLLSSKSLYEKLIHNLKGRNTAKQTCSDPG